MTAIAVLFLLALYFLPTILAAVRKHPSVGAVAVINFFFGWTVIGWILALAKAAGNASRGEVVVQQTIVQHAPPVAPAIAGAADALASAPALPDALAPPISPPLPRGETP
jgi:uncharacterized BrkB/YihY/UPF0761 family membrane protein